ncbi:MAG: DUF6089 family protein [Candidatus Pseudobacter hemicellulosilyticus]|uniref:DUF6089 family protein n=1 Tax=Candidatus Pseudobacter hemicellulosilyticus TaxID=3121375 RepID=A0AAJ5WQ83_9BACT|nr:MAG: DUF6089 family protein [Pseudobacter sp.]
MRIIWAFCLFLPIAGMSQQRLHITAYGGLMNYQGDLQEKNFTLDQARFSAGFGLQYDLTERIAVRAGFAFGKVQGNDKLNKDPFLKARNLSFQSHVNEGHLLLQYTFFDLNDKKISPYVFGGVALYHFNPYAYDTSGNKLYLKPLSTEGQGLPQYPSRKDYKLTQFAVPFGVGVKFRVSDNVVLGYEIGLRKLFNDYLDDVSTRYIDPNVLFQERGQKAVEMSYRGGELKDGVTTYPDFNIKRGGPARDWYYTNGITLTIGLNTGNGSSYGGGRYRNNQMGCPKVN